jgi:prefoldin subunit 5
MEKSTEQVEKNVSASFGYVKKDMLMLNDAFSDLHDKVQRLTMSYEKLREEIDDLKPKSKKKAVKKKK